MSLIKSISGIRGTIGGNPGEALTPVDIVKFVSAYCARLKKLYPGRKCRVVVGRDARLSGEMVESLVCGTLAACGTDVIKAGLASTPTTEMAVIFEKADGGIIITASHNPRQWNALKLLNERGEFLDAREGAELLECADKGEFSFAQVDMLGKSEAKDFAMRHVEAVVTCPYVDVEAIRKAGFKVALDAVNSVGGIIMPMLFERLGVECVKVNCEPTGDFAHNPEPLPANLTELSSVTASSGADFGVSVDPDVDRIALMCEDGTPFGEEYTLVAVSDYVLANYDRIRPAHPIGNKRSTVSNLSSSRALRDVTEARGGTYTAAAVGEVNVTAQMRRTGAVIGGEGNGGVIFPEVHYGRDALVGAALFLSYLAHYREIYPDVPAECLNGHGIVKVSAVRDRLPRYSIEKHRIELTDPAKVDIVLDEIKKRYSGQRITDIDGVKIDFDAERKWVHLRKSNTEPIIRVYAEAPTSAEADAIAGEIVRLAASILG